MDTKEMAWVMMWRSHWLGILYQRGSSASKQAAAKHIARLEAILVSDEMLKTAQQRLALRRHHYNHTETLPTDWPR